MKKNYLLLFLFLSSMQMPFKTIAQCNPAIPANANVVDSTDTINGGFTPQWVCKDDTLVSGGGIFFVYLEAGAVMNTTGGIDSIYVKNQATLNMNGGIHVILHEPSAIINVTGGIPSYYPCPSITFDYTNAPLNGCFITSVNESAITGKSISVYPVPAKDNFTITFPNTINKGVIEIYNVMWEKVFKENISNASQKEIRVNNIKAGIYFVKVTCPGGIGKDGKKEYTQKLVVQ